MIAPAVWAGSVNILSQGWFIFGGQGNNLQKAQKYVNDEWELGPDLLGQKPTLNQCVTQVMIFCSVQKIKKRNFSIGSNFNILKFVPIPQNIGAQPVYCGTEGCRELEQVLPLIITIPGPFYPFGHDRGAIIFPFMVSSLKQTKQ